MPFRITIIAVAIAVFAGGSLGTSNGMVLCIDASGHLALEPPHLRQGHHHDAHGDHEPHDGGEDADHVDLHGVMEPCSDSLITLQKLERSSSTLAAVQHHLCGLELCPPAWFQPDLLPSRAAAGPGDPSFRGGTAHLDLACLASVILLV